MSRILRDGNRAGEVLARIRALVQKTDTERVRLDINQTIQEVVVLMQNDACEKEWRYEWTWPTMIRLYWAIESSCNK